MAPPERDELDSDFEYESEEERDDNTMQVRGILDQSTATVLSTKKLHGPFVYLKFGLSVQLL